MFNSTVKIKKSQGYLKKPTEKKMKLPLFLSFMTDKKIKLRRLKECGNFLSFISNENKTNFRLINGNFCKNRFCPICSWLKARKNAFELLELLKAVKVKENFLFLFLTLTAPNVIDERLDEEIKDFNIAFKRLFQTKEFKIFNKGFIRKLEVTYNEERNDYHPHFHVIVAVNKSYFTSRDYLSKKRLLELWQRSKRDNSITQVDIKPCRMETVKEIMEIATYSTKQGELYKSKEIFDVFYNSLKGKQLIVFNGVFKKYRKLQQNGKLDFEDLEFESLKEKANFELGYAWQLKEYKELFERILDEDDERTLYKLEIEID